MGGGHVILNDKGRKLASVDDGQPRSWACKALPDRFLIFQSLSMAKFSTGYTVASTKLTR